MTTRKATQLKAVSATLKKASQAGVSKSKSVNYKKWATDLASAPSFKYIVGGVALTAAAGILVKMSGRYPEISNFFSENLSTVENKLKEFRDGFRGEEDTVADARH